MSQIRQVACRQLRNQALASLNEAQAAAKASIQTIHVAAVVWVAVLHQTVKSKLNFKTAWAAMQRVRSVVMPTGSISQRVRKSKMACM